MVLSRDDLLNLRSFVRVLDFVIWLSITRTVYHEGARWVWLWRSVVRYVEPLHIPCPLILRLFQVPLSRFRITKGITLGGDCHFTAAGPACPLDVLGLGKMWAPGLGLQRSQVKGDLLPWNIPGDLDVPWTVSGSYS